MFRSFKTIIRDYLIYFLVELLVFNSCVSRSTTAQASTQHASQVPKHMLPHDNNEVFINILNILRIEYQQLNEEINEVIPDDGLKGSKHVGLFIKSVLSDLSDFSVTYKQVHTLV